MLHIYTNTQTDSICAGRRGLRYELLVEALNSAGVGPSSRSQVSAVAAQKPSAPQNFQEDLAALSIGRGVFPGFQSDGDGIPPKQKSSCFGPKTWVPQKWRKRHPFGFPFKPSSKRVPSKQDSPIRGDRGESAEQLFLGQHVVWGGIKLPLRQLLRMSL